MKRRLLKALEDWLAVNPLPYTESDGVRAWVEVGHPDLERLARVLAEAAKNKGRDQ